MGLGMSRGRTSGWTEVLYTGSRYRIEVFPSWDAEEDKILQPRLRLKIHSIPVAILAVAL